MAESAHQINFSLQNSLSELDRLSEKLSTVGEQWEIPGKAILQINLVLDELFTNVVSYGLENDPGQDIDFSLSHKGDEIKIVVSDGGREFDPTQAPDPNLDLPLDDQPIGGLGIFLMRQYADTIEYRRDSGRNIVTLTKKI